MKVMITGAAGQLGRALVSSAPPAVEIVPTDRVTLDLADLDAVRRTVDVLSPDLILNAGAWTAVDLAEGEPAAAHVVNAGAVEVMAEALRERGGRLVQISTDFVFDGESSRAYRTSDTRNPLSVYGKTKAAGEDAAGPDAIVVRTGWVHGANGANFVTTMLRLMRTRDEVRVVADQIGAPTWTGGLASAIWALAERGQAGIWHWTDAGIATWYDFAVAIQEEAITFGLLDRTVPTIPITSRDFPLPAKRPAFSLLDSTLTREVLGLQAVHWRTNLRCHLEQLRTHGE